jgi:two-component system, sensor histidine kinase and response regulator
MAVQDVTPNIRPRTSADRGELCRGHAADHTGVLLRQLILPVTRSRQVDVSVRRARADVALDTFEAWRVAVSSAVSAVVLLDVAGVVHAISRAAGDLIGTRVTRALGRPVLDLLTLVDFHSGAPTREYAQRIPPLVTIESELLSRGLFRVRRDGGLVTIDAVSAPVYDADHRLVGSITFLSDVGHGTR